MRKIPAIHRPPLLLGLAAALVLTLGYGQPGRADDAVSVGAGTRFICQTSAPAPINRARSWVKCSTGHLMYTSAANIDIDVSVGSAASVFNVQTYGAKGDGVTDDTAAIQAAVAAADVSGGTVYFPTPGRYAVSSQILIKSLYPVNLVSDMYGGVDTFNQASTSFIMPIANFGTNAMIRYEAPAGGHSASHGAGLIRGLAFYDPFGGGHIGHYTMLAALDLYDFNMGRIEDCSFQVLNGGAIRSVFWVMGSLKDSVIRYSGTVAQPAISLESASATVAAQSLSITGCKIEANYGVSYLKIDSNCAEVKLSHLGFEALTTDATTCNPFIDNSGQRTFMSDIHLSRNTATQLILQAASNHANISGITINTNSTQTSSACVTVNGANHTIRGLAIRGATAQTTDSITVTGAFTTLSGINIINSGGITISGNSYVQISDVYISDIPSTYLGTYAIDLSSSYSRIHGAIIKATPTNLGGIRVSGAAQSVTVSNCIIRDITGTGVAFRDENTSNRTTWANNHGVSNVADFSWNNTTFVAIGNQFTTTILITPWVTPSLSNSWVAFDANHSQPGYFRDADNVVHIRGCVKSGSAANAVVFNLPAGYRPLTAAEFTAYINGTGGVAQVAANGNVNAPIGSTAEECFDGITFPAEQ